jgi:hypothetical protein
MCVGTSALLCRQVVERQREEQLLEFATRHGACTT